MEKNIYWTRKDVDKVRGSRKEYFVSMVNLYKTFFFIEKQKLNYSIIILSM